MATTNLKITKEQEDNLRILADYLLAGNLKAEFDMIRFCENELMSEPTNCGSVGCAIGHGPYAGISKNNDEGFLPYSYRVFGFLYNEWLWCFGPSWARRDNTPEGAGKRILILLEEGLPENWYYQMYGEEELCY